MQHFVYVLKSQKDLQLYVGITSNLQERILRHNQGRVSSTKKRIPFSLLYREIFDNRQAARAREKFLKSGKGREFLKNKFARVVELADTPA